MIVLLQMVMALLSGAAAGVAIGLATKPTALTMILVVPFAAIFMAGLVMGAWPFAPRP
jgi:hypothetical protein